MSGINNLNINPQLTQLQSTVKDVISTSSKTLSSDQLSTLKTALEETQKVLESVQQSDQLSFNDSNAITTNENLRVLINDIKNQVQTIIKEVKVENNTNDNNDNNEKKEEKNKNKLTPMLLDLDKEISTISQIV